MVAEARANIVRPGSAFDVVDAQQLPFADASLDAVAPANHALTMCRIARAHQRICPRTENHAGKLFLPDDEWREEHMAEIPMLIAPFNRLNGGILPAWPKLGFTLLNAVN